MKHKKQEDNDDEDNNGVSVIVGDLAISSRKSNLKVCQRIATQMLKDKTIRNYLGYFKQKKLLNPHSALGVG